MSKLLPFSVSALALSARFPYRRVRPGLPIRVLTDCTDDNARTRVVTRCAALFPGANVEFLSITSTLQMGGMIIDILDALDGSPAIILANKAPRHGEGAKHTNGTPFGATWIGNVLVVGTIDGYTFSFLKEFGLIRSVNVYDLDATLPYLGLDEKTAKRVKRTQFRSFEYLPRLAKLLASVWGRKPKGEMMLSTPRTISDRVWHIDNFGNMKLTLTNEAPLYQPGQTVGVYIGDCREPVDIVCYERLTDIPEGDLGLVVGSSGYGDRRFLELQVRGGSAFKRLNAINAIELETRIDLGSPKNAVNEGAAKAATA